MPRNVLRFTIVVLILSAQWQSTPTGICSAEQDLSPWVWPFTHEQKRAIVETHNMLRREVIPEASNMRKMVWDDDLAQLAQDWSEECIFAHTPDKEYGQNLATHDDVLDAIDAWYSEGKFYDYSTNTCSGEDHDCGHYETVVWATTYRVGCGIQECDNYHVTTCNYFPEGNYPGMRPYKSGHHCSQCSNPSWCEDKLCNPDCMVDGQSNCECLLLCLNCATKVTTDDCKCSCNTGWMGLDCTDECADSHYYCWDGWYPMLCGEPEWDFVAKYCPLMCGVCVDEAYIPEEHCCDGKQCSQGVIDGATCDCSCYEGYGADYECVESVSGSKTLNLNVIPIVMTSLLLILVC